MKSKIIKVLTSYNFNLTVDNDDGLIFEGKMICEPTFIKIVDALATISSEIEAIPFQIDNDNLMIAVFYQMLKI